jgi:hypothetical protein
MEVMTGDAPQPGETPRSESTPWTWSDPVTGAWWQGPEEGGDSGGRPRTATAQAEARAARERTATPTMRPPEPVEHTGDAGEAHEAGMRDAARALGAEPAPPQSAILNIPGSLNLPTEKTEAAETKAEEAEAAETKAERTEAAEAKAEKIEAAEKTQVAERTQVAEAKQIAAPEKKPVKKAAKPRAARPKKTPEHIEHAHDAVDAERFNAAGTTTAYISRSEPEAAPVAPAAQAGGDPEPTIVDLLAALPVDDPRTASAPRTTPGRGATLEGETVESEKREEPESDRPTVALERGPVPGQTPASRSRLGRARQDWARADRALQDRVRHERTAALLETSPFWQGQEERPPDAAWPSQATREKLASGGKPRKPKEPRKPATGLVALLALGFVAAFFSWVSAEPFWLAVGHGTPGTVTVAQCSGEGVTQRCGGTFVPRGGAYAVQDIALLGVQENQRAAGSVLPARMVSQTSRQAYAGETGLLVQLRWVLGFLLVVLCGFAIAGLTGAGRLETARARRSALMISLAGPLVLLAGFLVISF